MCYIPGTLQGAGDTVADETDQDPCPGGDGTDRTAKAPRREYVWGVWGTARRAMGPSGALTGEGEEMVSERERDRIA